MDTRLREAVFEGLQNRKAKQKFKIISEATGISEGWLKMFSSGKIANPGGNQLFTLYNYLAKKPFVPETIS